MSTFDVKLTNGSAAVEIGESVAGAQELTMSGDIKTVYGSLLVPALLRASSVSVAIAHAYIRAESGSAKVKVVLYADDLGDGNPGTLIGTSDEVTITSTTLAWVPFPFSTPGTIPANTRFFLGIHADAVVRLANEVDTAYLQVANSDAYADGPSDPFGTPLAPSARKDSIYIEGVGTKEVALLLARGDEDEPRVRLGSREKEAAKAGQRGTIVIQSLHHGSGQHVSRDPMMYEFADGMFADEPGMIRTSGTWTEVNTVASAQPFHFQARGALFKHWGHDPDTDEMAIVIPTIFSPNASVTKSPLTNAHFTGSWSILSGNLFLGQQLSNEAGHKSTWAARHSVLGAYSNNAGFKASYLAGQAEKMWAVETDYSAGKTALKWSDDSALPPVFSSDFDYGGLVVARDVAVVGPHAVVAVVNPYSMETKLIAVDTSGAFTELVSDLPQAHQFSPFLGGQLLWMSGRPRALWIQDASSYRDLDIGAVDPARGSVGFPSLWLVTSSIITPFGVGTASSGREIFVGVYGQFTKRDGASVSGSAIVRAVLRPDGLFLHTVATPEGVSQLQDSYVMAMRIGSLAEKAAGDDGLAPRVLHVLTAKADANVSNSTVKLHRLEMWEGTVAPLSFDTRTKFLRTSRYSTPSRTTGQMEVLRGYVTKLPASNSVVVRVYLDGAAAETMNFSINSTGPFSEALPTNVIGRDIAIDFETNANGSVIIEFPWSIDYFAVPDQKDIVRLPILAGRDQLTRAGTLQKKTRAEILDSLADICASPELWTLSWWDATPDWDVIPIDYQAADTEPDFVPGAGAAVAWLTLQRL